MLRHTKTQLNIWSSVVTSTSAFLMHLCPLINKPPNHLVLPTPGANTMRPSPILRATLIKRPKRPYTFTQLITLSDGSTFLHRTTSPQPIHRSTKDTKNNALWNPSSQKLLNIEEDEAGRLRRFRKRFGRGFDVDATSGEPEGEGRGEVVEKADGEEAAAIPEESLLDLISGYGREKEAKAEDEDEAPAGGAREESRRSGKGKGGEK